MPRLMLLRDRMVLLGSSKAAPSWTGMTGSHPKQSAPVCVDIARRIEEFYPDVTFDAALEKALQKQQEFLDGSLEIQQMSDCPARHNVKMLPHQRVASEWLRYMGRAILADETGMGKTVESMDATKTQEFSRGLIICSGVKGDDWVEHALVWAGVRAIQMVGDAYTRQTAIEYWERNGGFLVSSYDAACIHVQELTQLADLVIIDEAHRMRNRKTDASKLIARICGKDKPVHVLTATPTVNKAEDIWTLLNLCDPRRFSSFWSFVYRFFDVTTNGFGVKIGDVKADEKEILEELLRPYILRRVRDSKIEVRRRLVEVELIGRHKELYATLSGSKQVTFDGLTYHSTTAVSLITRLRQLSLDPGILFPTYTGSSALDVLPSIVQESPAQVVIFANLGEALVRSQRLLDQAGITSVVLRGSGSKKREAEALRAFSAGEAQVMLTTHGKGGESLNFQNASRVILLELAWHPTGNEQAVGRINRHGQESPFIDVIVIHVPGTIQDHVWDIVHGKRKVTVRELVTAVNEEG